METKVRICSLEMSNIKNVRNGKIDMPNRLPGYEPERGELLGIYGQNGSGKTSVVNAFSLLKRLICGLPLEADAASLITCGEKEATVSVQFSVESDTCNLVAQYAVSIGHDADGARVRKERFAVKSHAPKARTNTVAEFAESSLPTDAEFVPNASFSKVLGSSSRQDLLINKVLAYEGRTSYIFNRRMYPLLMKLGTEGSEALHAVRRYAKQNLFIIDHTKSGLVNINLQPIPVSHKDSTCDCPAVGTCLMNLNEPSTLPLSDYREFQQSLANINQVMCKIIPGFHLQVRELGRELSAHNEELMRMEILASRHGVEIPLKFESDGIKKIISILLYWIIVSNDPSSCLIVDELDASIFEYLLGELLSVWEENAQGQLIFTAHNLHPLEMLDRRSVVFTTVDPNRRFIRMKNIKASNNLRDVYLRSIFIGGQEVELYEETNKTEIARAIRKTIPGEYGE